MTVISAERNEYGERLSTGLREGIGHILKCSRDEAPEQRGLNAKTPRNLSNLGGHVQISGGHKAGSGL